MTFYVVFSGIFLVLLSSQASLTRPPKATEFIVGEEEITDVFTEMLSNIQSKIPEMNSLKDHVGEEGITGVFTQMLSNIQSKIPETNILKDHVGEEGITDVFTQMLSNIQSKIPEMNSLKDHVLKRRTRSLFRLGLSAVSKLLKGAKMTGYGDYTKIYTKSGGYQRAVEDFYSVKPLRVKNVRTVKVRGGTVKQGELYDRTILLYKGDAHKRPSLVILKNKDMFDKQTPLDVIFYDD